MIVTDSIWHQGTDLVWISVTCKHRSHRNICIPNAKAQVNWNTKTATVALKIGTWSWVHMAFSQNVLCIQVYLSTWLTISELFQMSSCRYQNTPNQNALISKASFSLCHFFNIDLFSYVIHLCVCLPTHAQVCLWKSEDHSWVFSFSLAEIG